MRRRFPSMHLPGPQRGLVLAMSLIFLVILSLVGLYAMRGSIQGERFSKNMRAAEVAFQSAETAIRYCEDNVRTGTPGTIKVVEVPLDLSTEGLPTKWQTRANLFGNDSVQVPSAQLAGDGMRAPPVLPRCLIERFALPPAPGEDIRATVVMVPYLITAIGFSADAQLNGNNQTVSGGEVWLQTMLIP